MKRYGIILLCAVAACGQGIIDPSYDCVGNVNGICLVQSNVDKDTSLAAIDSFINFAAMQRSEYFISKDNIVARLNNAKIYLFISGDDSMNGYPTDSTNPYRDENNNLIIEVYVRLNDPCIAKSDLNHELIHMLMVLFDIDNGDANHLNQDFWNVKGLSSYQAYNSFEYQSFLNSEKEFCKE